LTQDSKASAFTRLLFAMKPWYAVERPQVDRARVATVADPVAVSRARALWLMLDAPDDQPPDRPSTPAWVRRFVPFLGRFWGEGLTKIHRLTVNEPLLDWARTDPQGFLNAARALVENGKAGDDPGASRLWSVLTRYHKYSPGDYARQLLRVRPQAITEAAWIVTKRPDAVRTVLTRSGYTNLDLIGGTLDRDLPNPAQGQTKNGGGG
jgi:hypothetical protein